MFNDDPNINTADVNRRDCSEIYTVKAGDTLYSIAVQFRVPIPMLMFSNRNINPYNLRIGQQICIPFARQPERRPECRDGLTPYMIQAGDTLYSIAKKNGTTVEEILKENKHIDPYNLIPGMKICLPKKEAPAPGPAPGPTPVPSPTPTPVPTPTPTPIPTEPGPAPTPAPSPAVPTLRPVTCPGGKMHRVERTDTLTKILLINNYTYAALLQSNPNVDFTKLKEGMEICIPEKDIFGSCASNKTYTTIRGDSVVSIAEKFTVKTDDLMIANPALRPTDFSVANTKVCIPRATHV